ncbi:MAG: hypothetical protein K5655_00870 [Lachnospiraceae bacterium]|nr:hypothetical protein [Lachnospiraceae bacterium]
MRTPVKTANTQPPSYPYAYCTELEGIKHPDHTSTIHVQIPSFRDPELINTIKSLRSMAADPDRIHIAVCCQGEDESVLEWLSTVPDLKFVFFTRENAPGTCRARYECNRLLSDEDYVLHIDSHMRFAAHWDVMLIDQLRRCGDEKAILTGYCQSYNELFDEPVDSNVFTDRSICMAIIETMGGYYGNAATPFLQAVHNRDTDGEPVRGAMVSAHFLFGPADIDREIPYDPYMFFVGDELPMALRYYTHGYNVYHPGICCVWHLYERNKVLPAHGLTYEWSDNAEGGMTLRLWIEKKRIMKLYGMETNDQNLEGFCLGKERSLQDFENFAGVSFKNREISERAYKGDYDPRFKD